MSYQSCVLFAEFKRFSQRCLVVAWSVSKNICSSQLALRCAAVWTERIWSVWRGSNEQCCFVPLLPRKHYIEYLSNLFYQGKLYHYNYSSRFIAQPYLKVHLLPHPPPPLWTLAPPRLGTTGLCNALQFAKCIVQTIYKQPKLIL